MENDENDLTFKENIKAGIFQIEFSNQNLDDNIKFRNWKKNMTKIYGNDLIFVSCCKDNIFFGAKRKYKSTYKFVCPKCKNYICSFCLKLVSSDYGDCCVRARLRSVYYRLPECSEVKGEGINCSISLEWLLIIPFLSFLYFIGGILNSLFFRLSKPLNLNSYRKFSYRYSDYYKRKSRITYSIIYTIKVLFAIAIMVAFFPFVILDFILTILLIISVPFHLYPLALVIVFLLELYDDPMY